ncbi:hypothetical protein [Puia sp.]|uniref:hypothetical protein n=1 Tax=Puia sp. TaxID=2045100 RepID=UPI002F401691
MIRKKVDAALQALPPSLRVSYTALQSSLLTGSMSLDGVSVRLMRDGHAYEAVVDRVSFEGIHFFELMRTHRLLLRRLRVEGIKATEEKMHLSLEGSVELDSVYSMEAGKADSSLDAGKVGFGELRLRISRLRCRIPEADEAVHLVNMELDSKNRTLRLDTLRLIPLLDREQMGKKNGHQMDVWEATSEGIAVDGLDIMGLREQRVTAETIAVHKNVIRVFRDRRLPLEPGVKPLPMESLRALPVALRIHTVRIGPTNFTYEELPKDGGEQGTLKIYRMTATLQPLINHPAAEDPAYLTLTTDGSLMNSGTVRATTRIPLHKDEPYRVDGAFHDLDVTRLNNPAENLGKLHLESGMLNLLDFHFEMSREWATGQVDGRYHELVVQKLRKNGKEDKFKSFALKHFIIPKNKEKATGKVNYKRDPERYFSYYLLHSLLVGVKSSFSLGFLLPG